MAKPVSKPKLELVIKIILGLYLGFLGLFSLDVFSEGYCWWEAMVALIIHNLPTLAILASAWLSWKHKLIRSLVFLGLAIFFTLAFNTYRQILSFLFISGPLYLISLISLLSFIS